MANYTKNIYDYDTILFIPAYKPPHKEIDDELANHRFQMVKLSVSGENSFGISNIEFQNERYSYTYLTIQELYKRYKIEGKIGFIIGADAFREVSEWYEADKLKELVHFIVFERDDEIDRDRLALLHHKGYKFSMAKMPPIGISSTRIRNMIESGKPINASVPPAAARYIYEHKLYRE